MLRRTRSSRRPSRWPVGVLLAAGLSIAVHAALWIALASPSGSLHGSPPGSTAPGSNEERHDTVAVDLDVEAMESELEDRPPARHAGRGGGDPDATPMADRARSPVPAPPEALTGPTRGRPTVLPGPARRPAGVTVAGLTPTPIDSADHAGWSIAESATGPAGPDGGVPDAAGCLTDDAGALARAWAAINPGEAARAFMDDLGDGEPVDGGIGGRLTADLRRSAGARPYLSERPAPVLAARDDGGYDYIGQGFDAIITADGDVEFDEHGFEMVEDPLTGLPIPGLFVFDVTDLMMRAQDMDPYQHERQWFLESTTDVRDSLAAAAATRYLRESLAALSRHLHAIWSDTATAAPERRRRIFALWNDCADDELGRRARGLVEGFIHERLPRGSADAYTAQEIARYEAQRVGPVAFDPYG